MYAVVVFIHEVVLCDHSYRENPYERGVLTVVLQYCDAVGVVRTCMNNPAGTIF